ncbi:MAG: cyclopropane fatty acyl phospholipid synthase [Planctomycetota bacterium]
MANSALSPAETTPLAAARRAPLLGSLPSGSPFPPPRDKMERLLLTADIRVIRAGQGAHARPWDLLLHNEKLSSRVKREGLLGLGDAYVDGWWDCDAFDDFFYRAFRADLPSLLRNHPRVWFDYLNYKLRDLQNRSHARTNVESHYNLGNDLFEAMLDPYMQYTCGYWATAKTLNQAQEDKLDLICRKLGLKPGMTMLDLGCGWGGLARFAAERYGVKVTAVTLSAEQLAYAQEKCKGLATEFLLRDYRDAKGTFDRITSIGMFEHVGAKHHASAMKLVSSCLADDGLALIHFIGTRDSFPNRTHSEVSWINKYIFPGIIIPSIKQIGAAIDHLFVLEDLHNFGAHYDKTLMAWIDNFKRGWEGGSPGLKARYGNRFYRMWMHYLHSCAGAFRSRDYQLFQLVLSKHGVPGGYVSVR